MTSYFRHDTPEQHDINFYTKEGCCLCDEAREMLSKLSKEFHLRIIEVDITSDPDTYERYKHTIPVIEIDGEARVGARFSENDLRYAIMEVEGRAW